MPKVHNSLSKTKPYTPKEYFNHLGWFAGIGALMGWFAGSIAVSIATKSIVFGVLIGGLFSGLGVSVLCTILGGSVLGGILYWEVGGFKNKLATAIAYTTGLSLGAIIGALLGTFLFPGIGTIFGALIGGAIASLPITGLGFASLATGNVRSNHHATDLVTSEISANAEAVTSIDYSSLRSQPAYESNATLVNKFGAISTTTIAATEETGCSDSSLGATNQQYSPTHR